jgi:hypothetical protein
MCQPFRVLSIQYTFFFRICVVSNVSFVSRRAGNRSTIGRNTFARARTVNTRNRRVLCSLTRSQRDGQIPLAPSKKTHHPQPTDQQGERNARPR